MNAIDTIKATYDTSMMVLSAYVADFNDADLMHRPGSDCNHLAWQMGHLISSECNLLNDLKPGAAIELPAGFAEAHSKEMAGEDDPEKFHTKQAYLDLFEKSKEAVFKTLDSMTEADLDGEAPEKFRAYFPTVGNILVLIATHTMMHAGQFVPVRRSLGKPIAM